MLFIGLDTGNTMLIWRLLIWGGGVPLRAKRRVWSLIIWQEAASYGHICKHVRQVIGRFTDLLYRAQTQVTERRWDSHTSRMLQSCKSVSAICSDREYWTFVLSSWSDINNCYSPYKILPSLFSKSHSKSRSQQWLYLCVQSLPSCSKFVEACVLS